VRHELIPYLETRFNPSIRPALARTAALLADEADLLQATAEPLWERAARRDGATVVVDRGLLAAAAPAAARLVVRRAFQETGGLADVGTFHVDAAIRLGRVGAPSGRRLPVPGGREIVCSFGDLRIGPCSLGDAFALPLAVPGRVSLPDGRSVSAEVAASPEAPPGGAVVTAHGALTVRTRRPGDRIRTRGRDMSLKRFFMERRVPTTVRERMPLVAAGADVLWIPGQASAEPSAGRLVRLVLSGTA
jgi:tRNA(Ile)-lysidine synthase